MRTSTWIRVLPAGLALAGAALLVWPQALAFSVTGSSLSLDQRDFRVFDNFQDASANDNTTPHPSWPGAVGAELAVWKAYTEWGSRAHGDGQGDPSQPGDLGSGGADFDPLWQGSAPGVGGLGDNVVSASASCAPGLVYLLESGGGGWRLRVCDNLLWDDGPGTSLVPGALDLQGVLTNAFGRVLGLASSSVPGATMFPTLAGNGIAARSIEADDAAGVQFIYGAASPAKPQIDFVFHSAGSLILVGQNFAPSANVVWFTEAGVNATGDPIEVSGVSASAGGTRIELAIPAAAGPGDVTVKIPGLSGATVSNAFPLDPSACSEPQVYCSAKVNSQGCASSIASSGVPSASAGAGFTIEATDVLGQVSGVLFYGKAGPAQVPFQGGFLCVAPPVLRTSGQSSGGNAPPASDCSGRFVLDFNAWIAAGSDPALVAGQDVWAQYWSRDPGFAPPNNTGLSDGLAFVICP